MAHQGKRRLTDIIASDPVICDIEAPCEDDDILRGDFKDWEMQSVGIKMKLGLPVDDTTWTDSHNLLGVPGGPNGCRCRDLINTAYGVYLTTIQGTNADTASESIEWYANISQAHKRRPWGPTLGCVSQSSMWYSFARDRVLCNDDVYRLMGWPSTSQLNFGDISLREQQSLIGESIFLPALGLIMEACWLNPWAPWWDSNRSAALRLPANLEEASPEPPKRRRKTGCSGSGSWFLE